MSWIVKFFFLAELDKEHRYCVPAGLVLEYIPKSLLVQRSLDPNPQRKANQLILWRLHRNANNKTSWRRPQGLADHDVPADGYFVWEYTSRVIEIARFADGQLPAREQMVWKSCGQWMCQHLQILCLLREPL